MKRSEFAWAGEIMASLLTQPADGQGERNRLMLEKLYTHDSRQSNVNLLRQSSLFRSCGLPYDEPADTVYLRQLSAKLHVFYGMLAEVRDVELQDLAGAREIHPYARSRVYDLRRYKAKNHWGPFMDDGSGRVDWEKVQAIFIVLAHGLKMLTERSQGRLGPWWDTPFRGLAAGSYKPLVIERSASENAESLAAARSNIVVQFDSSRGVLRPSVEQIPGYISTRDAKIAAWEARQAEFTRQDPYGVKGTWMRIVNFLDYHDLFAFNFTGHTPADGVDREPVTTQEAFRLILLKLWVTKIEWPDEDQDGSEDNQEPRSNKGGVKRWPVVHFAGRSRSLHIRWDPNANSHIRGRSIPSFWMRGVHYALIVWHYTLILTAASGSNPFYHVTGYVRAYYAPPAPAHEYETDPEPNLSHIYPKSTDSSPSPHASSHLCPAPPPPPSEPSPSSSWSTLNSLAPSSPDKDPEPTVAPESAKDENNLVVRWTTFSVFHGEERWRSEGVQIGGVKSARGILGNWFDKDYDAHGPAGPTGFWKLGDGDRWDGWDGERGEGDGDD